MYDNPPIAIAMAEGRQIPEDQVKYSILKVDLLFIRPRKLLNTSKISTKRCS